MRGKGARGTWGFDSPAHLGLGCGEGAGRREPAAAALMECGGGTAGPGKELGAAVGLAAEPGALL